MAAVTDVQVVNGSIFVTVNGIQGQFYCGVSAALTWLVSFHAKLGQITAIFEQTSNEGSRRTVFANGGSARAWDWDWDTRNPHLYLPRSAAEYVSEQLKTTANNDPNPIGTLSCLLACTRACAAFATFPPAFAACFAECMAFCLDNIGTDADVQADLANW